MEGGRGRQIVVRLVNINYLKLQTEEGLTGICNAPLQGETYPPTMKHDIFQAWKGLSVPDLTECSHGGSGIACCCDSGRYVVLVDGLLLFKVIFCSLVMDLTSLNPAFTS